MNQNKKSNPISNKTIFRIIIFILILACIGIYFGNQTDIDSYIKTKFTKTVEVEKPIEVVKWVEHTKMPTEKLIMYLKPSLDPFVASKIASAVDEYSKQHQLPKKLILSVIFKESSFNIFARSKSNAIGLMQIIPKYHEDKIKAMGIKDQRKLYHIENNIDLGCRVWKTYYDMSKQDIDETFHRYLSKNASEATKNAYKNAILEVWARLEFLEFQYKSEKEIEHARNNNQIRNDSQS